MLATRHGAGIASTGYCECRRGGEGAGQTKQGAEDIATAAKAGAKWCSAHVFGATTFWHASN